MTHSRYNALIIYKIVEGLAKNLVNLKGLSKGCAILVETESGLNNVLL